jgi:two-component system sensor histidine kinase UhpB
LDDTAEALPTTKNILPQLERMHDLTNTALQEIRRIILDLRPTVLDHLGLAPALRWCAETRLDGTGIRLSVRELGQARRLSPAMETALFRVVQEALNNVARHSRATRAELVLEFEPTQVQVWVKDNGKGFDPARVFSATDTQRGLGLLGMEERMSAMGGTLTIHSTPQDGTTIHLIAPIQG